LGAKAGVDVLEKRKYILPLPGTPVQPAAVCYNDYATRTNKGAETTQDANKVKGKKDKVLPRTGLEGPEGSRGIVLLCL
jgi:hypothetical protein